MFLKFGPGLEPVGFCHWLILTNRFNSIFVATVTRGLGNNRDQTISEKGLF